MKKEETNIICKACLKIINKKIDKYLKIEYYELGKTLSQIYYHNYCFESNYLFEVKKTANKLLKDQFDNSFSMLKNIINPN